MSTEDNIPSQIKFTNADVNASKVTRMNKKTASDGTHIGSRNRWRWEAL